MAISNLNDLFVHLLKDIYYAEKQVQKALPDMISKTDDSGLRELFETHKSETATHLKRLEKAFELCGEEAQGEKCPAIDGILEETRELMDEIDDADTLDAAMIAACQAIEHYEITRYGTIISYAGTLGKDEVVDLLRNTLAEEEDTDSRLNRLAEDKLNAQAV